MEKNNQPQEKDTKNKNTDNTLAQQLKPEVEIEQHNHRDARDESEMEEGPNWQSEENGQVEFDQWETGEKL